MIIYSMLHTAWCMIEYSGLTSVTIISSPTLSAVTASHVITCSIIMTITRPVTSKTIMILRTGYQITKQ